MHSLICGHSELFRTLLNIFQKHLSALESLSGLWPNLGGWLLCYPSLPVITGLSWAVNPALRGVMVRPQRALSSWEPGPTKPSMLCSHSSYLWKRLRMISMGALGWYPPPFFWYPLFWITPCPWLVPRLPGEFCGVFAIERGRGEGQEKPEAMHHADEKAK